MYGSYFFNRIRLALSLSLIFACALYTVADAQDVVQFPGQDIVSNQLGLFPGADTIPHSSGMPTSFLSRIPDLDLGSQYYFGNNVRTRRVTADQVVPFAHLFIF